MSRFDTFCMVDWSAINGKSPAKPSKDAIWVGQVQAGAETEPAYFRTRHAAEAHIQALIETERAAGRRLLIGFDFPFAYPRGFATQVTKGEAPFALWDWLAARIKDGADGKNNRFDVAEALNALFDGPGPFWGKPARDQWSGLPYTKEGIDFAPMGEKRACERAAKAPSSAFQLMFPPTVGSQVLMGLPMLARLRKGPGVAAWPFEPWQDAPVVLAEIWPGAIEAAVKAEMARTPTAIRDEIQVALLARAFSRLSAEELLRMMTDLPEIAQVEGWILGAGCAPRLTDLAQVAAPEPPPLRNDCFAMPAGVDWTPVDEALAHLKTRLRPVVSTEDQPLAAAHGRILAQDVRALRANPPWANTAVDGYGFAGGRETGVHRVPLAPGRAAAGAPFEGTVPPGQALRVLTGAALPRGVDTVILEEDTRQASAQIAFHGPLKPGANTRPAGEDFQAGNRILTAGQRLRSPDMALLSAAGVQAVRVYRPLRVAVLSTGDELAEAGTAAGPNQIYDANRPMLLGLVEAFGHVPVDMGRVRDSRADLAARLDAAGDMADVILTSGGASAGDEDHVSALLQSAGALALWRIAVKPGRPLALGLWKGKPLFGLPGNPVAALVCTLIFARPALQLLAGGGWRAPQGFDVPAAFSKRKKAGRREYLRARLVAGHAEVFASEGSGRISGLSWADGLVELDDGAREVVPGDLVRFLPYASFGIVA